MKTMYLPGASPVGSSAELTGCSTIFVQVIVYGRVPPSMVISMEPSSKPKQEMSDLLSKVAINVSGWVSSKAWVVKKQSFSSVMVTE